MNWKKAGLAAAGCLAAWALSGTTLVASTQDTQPAPPPTKKATTQAKPASGKTAAKKPADKNAKAAPKDAKAAAAGTCEPSRTFVPAGKDAAVCTPAAGPTDGQKFNTFEDIYVPPAPPAADGK